MANGDIFRGAYMFTGESLGAGAAITISVPFKPSAIEVINTTTNSMYFWQPSHGAAGATKIVDSGAGTTDVSTITSNGITAGSAGFILGTGVQTTNDVIYWKAYI